MLDVKRIGQFVAVTLPTLFLVVWSADALLLVAEDVFLISLLQLLAFAVFFWRYT